MKVEKASLQKSQQMQTSQLCNYTNNYYGDQLCKTVSNLDGKNPIKPVLQRRN